MDDPYHLERFVKAQAKVYSRVLEELRRGHKTSHWMWFIFPQIQGLGFSVMAREYAISSLAEARAYLQHPLLGPRLRECVQLILDVTGKTIHGILGSPDDLKFRSCMTLFLKAAPEDPLFAAALTQYCAGEQDSRTLDALSQASLSG